MLSVHTERDPGPDGTTMNNVSSTAERLLNRQESLFHWADYLVLGITLGVSLLVGLYYGCFGSKQKTDIEYLLANRQMKTAPVAISLIAGFISGITLLGTPADIYSYGTQYYAIVIGIFFMAFAICYLYIPVFVNLGVRSSFEYLNVRFRDNAVRSLSAAIFLLDAILTIPLYVYVPCLALEQVTGYPRNWIALIVMIITVTYTTLGGLKAVIWTDAIQMVIFCLPLLIIAILGTLAVGGWHVVWEEAARGGRLEFFNMTLNPLERTSFFAAVIGGFFHWTGYNAVNQTCVQRYLSVPTLRAARTTAYIFMVGVIGIITFCTYIGLVMFAYFRDCDPLQAHMVATSDQIVPLFVMQIEAGLHGLPGLFMAGVLSAALSSISVALNSSAGVILDDLWRPFAKKELTGLQGAVFAKVACVVLGVLCTGLTMAMSGLQYMIQVAMTIMGIAAGTQFGITSLGMFNPWANWKGALAGGIASLAIVGWISVGNELMSIEGRLNYPSLPVNMSGCQPPQQAPPIPTMDPTILPVYRLSFLYVALLGWVIVMVVGSVVSWLTGAEDPDRANPDAHTPLVAAWLRKRQANKKAGSLSSQEHLDRVSVSTVSINLKQA